jgi:hypothetical protein
MHAPFQSPDVAWSLGNLWIEQNLQKAVQAQLDWEQGGHTGNSKDALEFFGNALHTVTDRASPWHDQTWFGINPVLWGPSLGHGLGEKSLGPSREAARGMAEHEAALLWLRYQARLREERKKREEEERKKKEEEEKEKQQEEQK